MGDVWWRGRLRGWNGAWNVSWNVPHAEELLDGMCRVGYRVADNGVSFVGSEEVEVSFGFQVHAIPWIQNPARGDT